MDNPKLGVFIDASNLWQAQKVKGQFFDLRKLATYLKTVYRAKDILVYYYDAYPENGTREYSLDNKHKFYTFLKKQLRFVVRKKPLKRIVVQSGDGHTSIEKGNMDVEMTIDMVDKYQHYDIIVLFSGDSDFQAVINYLKSKGRLVYIYSSRNNISKELISSGSGYTDVLTLGADIWGKSISSRVK